MKPIIHRRPDMLCETAALLYISRRRDELVEMMISIIGERDWDVREFMTRYESFHKRYVHVFNGRRIDNEYSDFFFENMDIETYLIITMAFLLDKDLVYNSDTHGINDLRDLIKESYTYIRDMISINEITQDDTFEEYLNVSEELKEVYENPTELIGAMAGLIRSNVPAAEDAWDAVRDEAREFLAKSWNDADEFYQKSVLDKSAPIKEVYPLPSIYTNAFVVNNIYYYGLFNADVRPEEERINEHDQITKICKAIGDKTRTDMLFMLRERPRYNREVAAQLGLTPATVMHHMDILLGCGLVKMTTWDDNQKRIYYCIDKERAEWLLLALKRLLADDGGNTWTL